MKELLSLKETEETVKYFKRLYIKVKQNNE